MRHIDWIWLVSRWLHILAVVLAIGGSAYSYLALIPASDETLDETERTKLREAIRRRWAKFVNISIAVLLITGSLNFIRGAIPPHIPAIPYHPIFGVKLLAAIAVFFIASALLGKSPGFATMRAHSRKWFGVIVLLGVLIILLSGALNQIRNGEARDPTPRVSATESGPA